MELPSEKLRLKWTRTWPDKACDFAASDAGRNIGRIYLMPGVGNIPALWHWACYGQIGRRLMNQSGKEEDPVDAAIAVETEWFKALTGVQP